MKVPEVPSQLVQAAVLTAVSQQGTGAAFLLDQSLEKERRSGALWVTGNHPGPATPWPDSRALPPTLLRAPASQSSSAVVQPGSDG